MRWPAVPLLLVVSLVPTTAKAERFRYRYAPGQVIQSLASLAGASMMGPAGQSMLRMQYRMKLRQTQRVRSVGGGIITLDVTETPVSGRMTIMGRTEESRDRSPRVSTVRMTERGRFLSRLVRGKQDDAGDPPGLEGADALYGLCFPDRNLEPGDTWEETVVVGTPPASRSVRLSSRFEGREVFRGRRCARITTMLSMPFSPGEPAPGGDNLPAGRGRLTGTITTFFDPAAGVEVYSRGWVAVVARTEMNGAAADAGEFASVIKINVVQSLLSSQTRK